MILETDILSCTGGLSQFTMEGINENLRRWENIGHKYILSWEVGQWKEWKRMEALAQFRENFSRWGSLHTLVHRGRKVKEKENAELQRTDER